MSSDLRSHFDEKSTEELLEILRVRDEVTWRPEVFSVVESIVRERGSEVPNPDPPAPHDTHAGEPVEVCALPDPALIPVAKSLLDEAGIEYFVRDEASQNLFAWGQAIAGFNPVLGPPVILVPAASLEEAQELLAPLLQESGSPPEDDDV